jgi:hypothetical protein
MTDSMTLVTSPDQVRENIHLYNDDASKFAVLMPFARAWYALETKSGWLLAPSKMIGYQNLNADEYLARHRDGGTDLLDGRVTENVIQQWGELVEEGHPLYETLRQELNALCARFGKKPNKLARISIVQGSNKQPPAASDALVTLLAAGFKSLSPAQQTAFHKLTA